MQVSKKRPQQVRQGEERREKRRGGKGEGAGTKAWGDAGLAGQDEVAWSVCLQEEAAVPWGLVLGWGLCSTAQVGRRQWRQRGLRSGAEAVLSQSCRRGLGFSSEGGQGASSALREGGSSWGSRLSH